MSALREKHSEFQDMEGRWELCEDLFGGEHEIHEKGETYLPMLQDEDGIPYQARKAMTPVFGAYFVTVKYMRGMLFRKPPQIVVPTKVVGMMSNIDLAGNSLQSLLKEVADIALTTGRVGLLVDSEPLPDGATKADATAVNHRPKMVLYKTTAIYNWHEEVINGVTVPAQIRLEECINVRDEFDEFKFKEEKRYRVLDLIDGKYRQRVFKVVKDEEVQVGEDVYPKIGGKHLDYIPFEVIGADGLGLKVSAPPFIDLATTVLHHYMQATSYERGCFFSGLPMYNIFGVNPENADGTPLIVSLGGNIANIFPRAEAHAETLEVTSKFEALRTNLEDKKREMAVLGARFLEQQKAGVESADAIARRMSGEESGLSIMSQIISQGVSLQLQRFCDFAGATGEASVALTRDFLPAGITAQEITALLGLRDGAAISQETLFNNLKAGEVIADDVTFEEEQERIASSFVGMTPPAADPYSHAQQRTAAEGTLTPT